MHIISKLPFKKAIDRFPQYENSIMNTYSLLSRGSFNNSQEMRETFPSLNNFVYEEHVWVIDLAGGLRLMMRIAFNASDDGTAYIRGIYSHDEYMQITNNAR